MTATSTDQRAAFFDHGHVVLPRHASGPPRHPTRVTVGDVMTAPAPVVAPQAPLSEVVRCLTAGVRALVVALGSRPLGVVTARHLLTVVDERPDGWRPRQAGDLVAPRTSRLLPGLDLAVAAGVMSTEGVEALPVVDYRGDLVGLLDQQHVIEHLAR
jgi:CBS domain-containing protein